jgi:hypothetical protein
MDALRQAIYDTLAADGTLTSLIASYRGDYAIVDGYTPPLDMEVPLIHYEIVSDDNFDSKTGRIRIIIADITVMTSTNSDPVTIAERIRTLLHRVAITVSGWTNIITEVNGPVQGVQTESTKTAILSVEFTLA